MSTSIPSNDTVNVSQSDIEINWKEWERCKKVLENPPPHDGGLYCPAVFDLWMCWDHTPAGTTNYQPCPVYFNSLYNPDGYAKKVCHKNGSWYIKPESGQVWTDYRGCKPSEIGDIIPLYITIAGYALSCVLLVASLIIFATFKQLRCTRVVLHEHLFVSFILTGVLWVTYYAVFMDNPKLMVENGIGCRFLHILTQYVSVCNYFWMFCEGFFLHTIIVQAFSKQKKLLHICIVIGWVVPLLPVLGYLLARLLDKESDNECWIHPAWTIWILIAPIFLSLLLNLGMLLNVLRILVSKIRAFNGVDQAQYSRAAKAVLILIPLLGLQNLLTPTKPSLGRRETIIWNSVSAFLISFQGAVVALIFCLLNGEVLSTLKRRWKQWRHLHDPMFTGRPQATSTVAMVLDDTTMADHIYRINGKGKGNSRKKSIEGNAAELKRMIPAETVVGKAAK